MHQIIFGFLVILVAMAALMFILQNSREPFLAVQPKGNTFKHGNNGSVSCETYCKGQWKGGPRGSCVRAHDDRGKRDIGCAVVRGVGTPGVTCECGPVSIVLQNQINQINQINQNDVLVGPRCMTSGLSLVSQNKSYKAVMQPDGNFVVYQGSKAIWATHHNTPLNSTTPITPINKPYRLCVEAAGNIVVRDKNNAAAWSSDSGGKDLGPFKLVMQNDGNLVLRGKNVPVWASKWTVKCPVVLNWWKLNKNAQAVNPWADYVARLKRGEYHVWPGPKCYDCEGAKRQYRLTYPDIGPKVDAAIHASGQGNRVWKGMTNCLPKPVASVPLKPKPARRVPPPPVVPAHPPPPVVPAHPPPESSPFYGKIMELRSKHDGSLYANNSGAWGSYQVDGLGWSKTRIWNMIQANHGSDKYLFFLVLACGMLETETMNVNSRDKHKDGMGWMTANYTFLNLCGDLIERVYPGRYDLTNLAGCRLNQDTDEQINEAINILKQGITMWGIFGYCNFVRGGWSGFTDPGAHWDAYHMGQYFHGLSFTISKMMEPGSALGKAGDNTRVWVNVAYV